MKEADRKARNETRLAELFPTFSKRVARVIGALEGDGVRPRIQDAWRSPADQKKAFDAGNSKLLFGFHNVTGGDGKPEAMAVDMLDDDSPLAPGKAYLLRLAAAAEKEGLITGIRWGAPKALAEATNTAIAQKDWKADVKIGWDPTHIQPTDVTVAEAKAGKRPK